MRYSNLHLGVYALYVLLICGAVHTAHAVTPEQIFPPSIDGMEEKGVYVRKGTIKATFDNIQSLDKLLAAGGSEAEIISLMKDQGALSRGLYVMDLFEMQPVELWLRDSSRQGKVLVAVITLGACPELLTESVKDRLSHLAKTSHPIVKAEIKKLLI